MRSYSIRLFTIPNIITCLNLLAGCVGIMFAASGKLGGAMLCVLLSAALDFLDGLAARLLKQYSPVGVQLDSLADMVSFGAVPAVMLCCVLNWIVPPVNRSLLETCAVFSPFLLTVFSALRLAKFNVDDRQTTSFLGLPTPANALFMSSFAVSYMDIYRACNFSNLWSTLNILAVVALFCCLLVSEVPMFSLKIKDFSVKKCAVQLVFAALSVAVAALTALALKMPDAVFAAIVLLYIVLNLIKWTFTKKSIT